MAVGPGATITVRAAMELVGAHLGQRPLLVVSDFDGTLSKLVDDPWAATILPPARRALRSLAGHAQVHVALLTGRTAVDVAARVRVGGVRYVGNHGMERGFLARGGRPEHLQVEVDDAGHDAARVAELLAREVPRLISERWLVVEHKPPAVAFHYRTAPDLAAAGARLRATADRLDPRGTLERFPGRRVLELRPFGAAAKGEALAALVASLRPRWVVMLGDDLSDVPAFQALRGLRERGVTDGIALGVQARTEVPSEVLAASDVVLASPADAARFLAALARQVTLSDRAG